MTITIESEHQEIHIQSYICGDALAANSMIPIQEPTRGRTYNN